MENKENTRVLVFVYGGYIMRYLYLLVVIPFYGRVLGVTARGASVRAAQAAAYRAVDAIDFPSGFCRRDIGWREVAREDAA